MKQLELEQNENKKLATEIAQLHRELAAIKLRQQQQQPTTITSQSSHRSKVRLFIVVKRKYYFILCIIVESSKVNLELLLYSRNLSDSLSSWSVNVENWQR